MTEAENGGERLTLAAAEDLVAAALEASRTGAAQARAVARALVAAEAEGQGGHGLARVSSYAAQARAGKVDGFAEPAAEMVRPGFLSVDAGTGFAYPALDLAREKLAAMAAAQGIAAAAIRRSHHCGSLGLQVGALAEAGLMALMVANTPKAMAPWGGGTALFGTNPIAFAAPLAGAAPIVIDLSLSEVARGKVMAAAKAGREIPEGWALDAEGRPTTDPKAALAGTMLPAGGAKGAALALMVELLAGALAGPSLSFEASSFLDAEGAAPAAGQLLIAIDPGCGDAVAARVTRLAEAIEADPGARLPGRRGLAARQKAAAEGLAVPAHLLTEIRALAAG
ncbi:Ldh family oxidoreductase [Paralimibaculum aggregatum]|uniref:Ldh family oxidoreductase n=1 Tax=Paralimibaculum aggregatum TaxID=3036245 RepID=A0ABQ6LLT5_9RHOB|nr:Ldh family oxidoreductase [Limibaculum sp. NKW23]GMG81381.1 Ldh family oxidoreductase [Limibaculum sp. NKW23]